MIRQGAPIPPCLLVVFGAGGDLARSKLVPTLYNLASDRLLPDHFGLIGTARENIQDDEFRRRMSRAITEHVPSPVDPEVIDSLVKTFHYLSGDSASGSIYDGLKALIEKAGHDYSTGGNVLFYLATPPALFPTIPQHLSRAGLLDESSGSFRRVIFEKPFGHDLSSAHELNVELSHHLRETQIFRIDHYLGKETVQNIMALRFSNNIFEPLWNQHYIDSIQITVAETEGIDGRGAYYEGAGALRDMVPNHLFQLVSLIGMVAPNSFEADDVRDEKLKVIEAIRPFTVERAMREVVRGQYGPPRQGGPADVRAYHDEPKVERDSQTETFVAMRLEIDNWRWAGVPFYLRTGKRLAEHETEVSIQFRHVPVQMFRDIVGGSIDPNILTLQIFPKEEISLSLAAKVPGTTMRLGRVLMTFDYETAFDTQLETGYETLLYDAITGDNTLYMRADEVEAAWKVVAPILEAWQCCQTPVFPNYPSGSWGPPDAQALLARDGRYWRERAMPQRMVSSQRRPQRRIA